MAVYLLENHTADCNRPHDVLVGSVGLLQNAKVRDAQGNLEARDSRHIKWTTDEVDLPGGVSIDLVRKMWK